MKKIFNAAVILMMGTALATGCGNAAGASAASGTEASAETAGTRAETTVSSADAADTAASVSSADTAKSSGVKRKKAETITVTYQKSEGGKVSRVKEYLVKTDHMEAKGAEALEDGFSKFVNWTDESGKVVSEETAFTPSDLSASAVYTANFQKRDITEITGTMDKNTWSSEYFEKSFTAGEGFETDLPVLGAETEQVLKTAGSVKVMEAGKEKEKTVMFLHYLNPKNPLAPEEFTKKMLEGLGTGYDAERDEVRETEETVTGEKLQAYEVSMKSDPASAAEIVLLKKGDFVLEIIAGAEDIGKAKELLAGIADLKK